MLTQERANLVLHNMRQRAPDNTDPAVEHAARPSSSSVRPSDVLEPSIEPGPTTSAALMDVGGMEENQEEEAPTSHPEDDDGAPK